jgi:hypothetical protein
MTYLTPHIVASVAICSGDSRRSTAATRQWHRSSVQRSATLPSTTINAAATGAAAAAAAATADVAAAQAIVSHIVANLRCITMWHECHIAAEQSTFRDVSKLTCEDAYIMIRL